MGKFSENFLSNNTPKTDAGIGQGVQQGTQTLVSNSFSKQFGVPNSLQYKAPVSTPQIQPVGGNISTQQPQEQKNVLQKVADFVSGLIGTTKARFSEGFQEGGLAGGAVNVFLPFKNEEEKQVFRQNMKTYIEAPKGEEILTEMVMNVAANKFEQFAAAGAGISGIIAPGSLTEFDRKLLEKNGYLDENGNIKKGKTAIETAKNVMDISIFFPQLYIGLEGLGAVATGGKTLSIAGKSVSIGRVLTGTVVGGTYNTLYTPKL